LKLQELKDMIKDIEYINKITKEIEYHKSNTLPKDRKDFHRKSLIPMLDDSVVGMKDIINNMCESLPLDTELPDSGLREMVDKTKMYRVMIDEIKAKVDKGIPLSEASKNKNSDMEKIQSGYRDYTDEEREELK